MKIYKKSLVILLILISICTKMTFSYAATSGTVNVSCDSSTVTKGSELKITIKAQDSEKINAIDFGEIIAYKSDNTGNKVETIVVKDIKVDDSTSKYIEGNTTTITYNGEATTEAVTMSTIILTIDAEEGNYVISIPNIHVYNGNDESTDIGTKNLEISVKSEKVIPEEQPQEPETGKTKTDTTKKTTKKLPQTGIENIGIIAIVALGFVSIISYISYRKYKNI